MVDITLAVLLALAALLMAYLGFQISIHPPDARWQSRYKVTFVVLGALSVALVLFQAKRNVDAQGQLTAMLDRIENQTKQPPTVNVSVPSPVVHVMPASQPTQPPATERPALRPASPSPATPTPTPEPPHPVITVSRTKVTQAPKSLWRAVLLVALKNTGDDVQARVAVFASIEAKPARPLVETRSLFIARGNEVEFTMTLPPEVYVYDVMPVQTRRNSISIAATYTDRGSEVTYVFEGHLTGGADTLDVLRSEVVPGDRMAKP